MLKSILLLVSMLSLSTNAAIKCDRWEDLDLEQKSNLHSSFASGKAEDLGWTLATIALIESNAGRWRLNYKSNDFGLFQINIETAANLLEIENHYKKFELAERLLYDDVLGAELAISVLKHFKQNRMLTNEVFKETIMSYNRGYSWRTNRSKKKEALEYYNKFRINMLMLKQCSDLGR